MKLVSDINIWHKARKPSARVYNKYEYTIHYMNTSLTHRGWDKMTVIFQTTNSTTFSCMKIWISLNISLMFVSKVRINIIPALVDIITFIAFINIHIFRRTQNMIEISLHLIHGFIHTTVGICIKSLNTNQRLFACSYDFLAYLRCNMSLFLLVKAL